MRSRSPLASLIVVSLLVTGGCDTEESGPAAHLSFAAADEAVAALALAVEKNDPAELQRLLGPGTEDLLSSGDAVADRNAREGFLERFRANHSLVAGGPNDLVLQVGSENWPLPIPLVRRQGRWQFDGAEGAHELVVRRIGANELRTIEVMRGFGAAQRDYAADSHDGVAPGTYAQKLRSEAGKHDGLYWKVGQGEPLSPAGPLLAAATAEGYSHADGKQVPYHGYVYQMLFSQGSDAPGGARSYLVDGRLSDGFGLLARPAEYGVSGVMTFIVSQDGVVWQRDLGEDTARLAASIREVDPDVAWTPIAPDPTAKL
jgi:Protein of unknown function (DUF2950)